MTEHREMFGRIDASPPQHTPEQEPDAVALVATVRECEAHLQLAIETAEMGTWRWAVGSVHDSRDANLNNMLGLHAAPSTQPVGQTLDFVHAEDRMRIEAVLAQAIADLSTYDVAFRIVRQDGLLRWLRARGRVVAGTPPVVVGVVVDLSEQIRATTRNARLHGVTAALAAALTPHEVAEVIIQQALGALEADAGAVYALAGGDPTYTLLSSRGYSADLVERLQSAGPRLSGPIRAALETRELVLVESPVELLARWPDLASTPEGAGLAATVVVPLEVEHRLLGVFYAAFRYPRDFAADEIAFLRTLGHQCALALERGRLYVAEQVQRAAAEQSAARLTRLQAVTAALSRAHTPSEVAQVIMGEGLSALGAYAGALVVARPDRSIFEVVAAPNYSVATWPPVAELPWDADLPILDVVRTGKPLWIEDRDTYAARFPHLVERSPTTQALAAVPLGIDDTIFGAFGLSFDQPQTFVVEQQAAITTLAEQAAQAIQRGQLLDAEQSARRAADHARTRAEFLAEASRVLATSLDYEATLQQVAYLAVPRIADWAFVEMLEEDGSIRRMAMAVADPEKRRLLMNTTAAFHSTLRLRSDQRTSFAPAGPSSHPISRTHCWRPSPSTPSIYSCCADSGSARR